MSQTALLELADVGKRFGQVVVAERLTLSLPPGATLGIVGPNGAGKSSLFAMISGDLRPDRGDIRLDGTSILRLDAAARCRRGIGRTYQVPRPFAGMTVFENVLVAAQDGAQLRRQAAYDATWSALAETALSAHANVVAGRLGLLARKRLEVARALATQPRLLLLDEVAGGLTDPEVAELVEIVRAVKDRGVAVVWIEHVVRALLSTVDRLVCLAAGELVADGAPREVLATQRVRELFLGTESTVVSGGGAARGAAIPAGDSRWEHA